ncbi:MAG: hypothetical protein H0X33_01190 [Taibaiella sp.]|nr:hypothetical protein [Taibaiella sp.]
MGQTTFQGGWHIYKIGTLTRQYTYAFDYKDDLALWTRDSIITYTAPDSSVMLTINYSGGKAIDKTTSYLNPRHQIIKTEYYTGEYLAKTEQWRYDTFNHITFYSVHKTGESQGNFLRTYTYSSQKTAEGSAVTEFCHFNGRVEFETIDYYDHKNVKYKQVRMNDIKKVIHVETYKYDIKGHVTERDIYFPEYGVTKKFAEGNGDESNVKCYKSYTLPKEKFDVINRDVFVKREIERNKAIITGKECAGMEIKALSPSFEIIIKKDKSKNTRTAILSTTEHILAAPVEKPVKKALIIKPIKHGSTRTRS